MIRVKLLSEPEYRALVRERTAYSEYHESQFYHLLREKGDFTDAESLAILRHLHGEEAVTGKWYRRTTAEGAPCIPAISSEAKYGLVVLENSRRGCYTPIVEAFTDFEVEYRMEESIGGTPVNPLVWQAFAKLDTDILLTFRKKDFSFAWDIPIEVEFILENHPLNGVPTEVHVVNEFLRQPEQRNGEWYVQNFFYDWKYRWSEDTAEILNVLRYEFACRPPLVKGLFPLSTFETMCRPRKEIPPRCADCPCAQPEESPWQVLNHMDDLPEEGDSRRLLYLIIEQHNDGTVRLGEDISVKYPSYLEMLEEAIQTAKPDCEVFVLPVDVNECMGRAEDIRKAVCAFRICGHTIETFGPADGLREFDKTLRQAVESGAIHRREGGDDDAEAVE